MVRSVLSTQCSSHLTFISFSREFTLLPFFSDEMLYNLSEKNQIALYAKFTGTRDWKIICTLNCAFSGFHILKWLSSISLEPETLETYLKV